MKKSPLRRTQIRSLKPGDPLPAGQPRRYRAGHGYIRLRWKVGPGQYLETYEHRVADGYVTTAEHVHHRNRRRDDNRPENLKALTSAKHRAEHRSESQSRTQEMAALYRDGVTTTELGKLFGLTAGHVSRSLRAAGVPMRARSAAREVDVAEIARLYSGGRSLPGLGRQFHKTSTQIRDLVVAEGVTIRRPGRPKDTSRTAENRAREVVAARSSGTCEVCGVVRAFEFQHRKGKAQGGKWSASNGLAVCGNGNYAGCHGRIHQNPDLAYRMGWSVRSGQSPSTQPVWLYGHGWSLIQDDGSIEPVRDLPEEIA